MVRKSFRARPKVPRHGPVRWLSRYQRAGCSMQGAPGGKVAMHKAAGKGGDLGGCPVAGHPCSRDVARDAPGSRYHKPKTPIGRRGESLICLRTSRVGAIASPAPLHCPPTRGGNACGGLVAPANEMFTEVLQNITGTDRTSFSLCSDSIHGVAMLTRKQHELLMFIHERMKESGIPPSFDEMKDALDLRSKSGIHRLITALEVLMADDGLAPLLDRAVTAARLRSEELGKA